MYLQGRGVDQDDRKAFEWHEKSAAQGNAAAQCNLGEMYLHGLAVDQDYNKAFEWYEKSAAQGNARSQCNLGEMYLQGRGVDQDDRKAFKWYKKSAAQGNALAQCSLGEMYLQRLAVDQDYNKAFEYLTQAIISDSRLNSHFPKSLFIYDEKGHQDSSEQLKDTIKELTDNLTHMKERMIFFEGYFNAGGLTDTLVQSSLLSELASHIQTSIDAYLTLFTKFTMPGFMINCLKVNPQIPGVNMEMVAEGRSPHAL
ncbi:MAG: sel1 repeat family protein [Candidatus Paracaedibacteraceae bacterium]|nr:sel1 repeat family protein [Candidatus Paracaedibacteraceae bacterium]